jgi:drug/metabolite transporter (DMT)-like permease
VPPLAIILGVLVFNEVPVPLAIAGGVLCLIGVGLTRRRAGRVDRPEVVLSRPRVESPQE